MTAQLTSDVLRNLVLFIIILAILGIILAVAGNFILVAAHQAAISQPDNGCWGFSCR